MIKSFLILTLLKLTLCKELCIPQGNKCLYKWQCCKGFHCENPHYQDEKHCIADHEQLEHKDEEDPEPSARTLWGPQLDSARSRDPRIRIVSSRTWGEPEFPRTDRKSARAATDVSPDSARSDGPPIRKSSRTWGPEPKFPPTQRKSARAHNDKPKSARDFRKSARAAADVSPPSNPKSARDWGLGMPFGNAISSRTDPEKVDPEPVDPEPVDPEAKQSVQETMMSLFEAGLQQLTQGKPIKMKVKVKNPEVLLSKLNPQPEPTPQEGEPDVDPEAFRNGGRRKFQSAWGTHHHKEDSDSGMENKQD